MRSQLLWSCCVLLAVAARHTTALPIPQAHQHEQDIRRWLYGVPIGGEAWPEGPVDIGNGKVAATASILSPQVFHVKTFVRDEVQVPAETPSPRHAPDPKAHPANARIANPSPSSSSSRESPPEAASTPQAQASGFAQRPASGRPRGVVDFATAVAPI